MSGARPNGACEVGSILCMHTRQADDTTLTAARIAGLWWVVLNSGRHGLHVATCMWGVTCSRGCGERDGSGAVWRVVPLIRP